MTDQVFNEAQTESKNVILEILKPENQIYKKFISQYDIVSKNLKKQKEFLKKQNINIDTDQQIKLLIIFSMPFQISKLILEKLNYQRIFSEYYFQEMNQDQYYIHDMNIEQSMQFDLNFWRVIIYLCEIKDLKLLYQLKNIDNNIQIMFDFMQQIYPLLEYLQEPPLFYFFLSFLAGKNLTSLIKQMNLNNVNIGRSLFESIQAFLEKYLELYRQLDMSQFIIDLFNRITFNLPNKEDIFNEDYLLHENIILFKNYLETQIRIFQFDFANLLPINIYQIYLQNQNKDFSLQNQDILQAIGDETNLENIKENWIEYNRLDNKENSNIFQNTFINNTMNNSQINSINDSIYQSNLQFMQHHMNQQKQNNQEFEIYQESYKDNHNYEVLNYFNSLEQDENNDEEFSSPLKQIGVNVVSQNDLTNTQHSRLERNNGTLKLQLLWGKKEQEYSLSKGFKYTKYSKQNQYTAKTNNHPFCSEPNIHSSSNQINNDLILNRYNDNYTSIRNIFIYRDEDINNYATKTKVLKDISYFKSINSQLNNISSYSFIIYSTSNGIQNKQKIKKVNNAFNFLIPSIKKATLEDEILGMSRKKSSKKISPTKLIKSNNLQIINEDVQSKPNLIQLEKVQTLNSEQRQVQEFKGEEDIKKYKKLNNKIFNMLGDIKPETLFQVQQEQGGFMNSIGNNIKKENNGNNLSQITSRLIASKASNL